MKLPRNRDRWEPIAPGELRPSSCAKAPSLGLSHLRPHRHGTCGFDGGTIDAGGAYTYIIRIPMGEVFHAEEIDDLH
jgi:hypothetical protein